MGSCMSSRWYFWREIKFPFIALYDVKLSDIPFSDTIYTIFEHSWGEESAEMSGMGEGKNMILQIPSRG